VPDALARPVGAWVVRAVALALTAGVDEHEAVIITQRLGVTDVGPAPVVEAAEKADVEDQRRPAALDLVIDANPVVDSVEHRPPSPVSVAIRIAARNPA